MTVLALYASQDTPGKRDASTVFAPEARRLAAMRDGVAISIPQRDMGMPARRSWLLRTLETQAPLGHTSLALFCHGWSSGIQLGPRLRWGKARTREVDELAEAIRSTMGDAPTVVLYACSTASTWLTGLFRRGAPGGDGGFADELRDALCRAGATGCRVFAHDRNGHSTRCAFVRVFEGDGSATGGKGGEWLIEPGSELWPAWRAALQGDGDLRLRFPFMTREAIADELSGP